MYIRPPSYSSRRASIFNQAVLSLLPFRFIHPRALPSRRSSGGTAVHTISANLPHFCLILVPSLVPLSLVIERHFHPRSTYVRHTTLRVNLEAGQVDT